jgi:hypothetical protein
MNTPEIIFTVISAIFIFLAIIMFAGMVSHPGYTKSEIFEVTTYLLFIAVASWIIKNGMSNMTIIQNDKIDITTVVRRETGDGWQLLTNDWSTRIDISDYKTINKLNKDEVSIYRQEMAPSNSHSNKKVFYKMFDYQGNELPIRVKTF